MNSSHTKRKAGALRLFVITVLGGCLLSGLFGCGARDHSVSGSASSGDSPNAPSGAVETKAYYIEDVRKLFSWIGQTREEIGISEEYVDDRRGISFAGELFGSAVEYGRISLLTDYDTGREKVEHIYCLCSELPFADAELLLAKVYGRPCEIGEEPYAEVNGGAVTWRRFPLDNGTIQISKPDRRDYFFIDVSPGGLPDDFLLTPDEFNNETRYGMSFDDGSFSELTCRVDYYTGESIYGLSFLHEGVRVLADVLQNCEELPELYQQYTPVLREEPVRVTDDAEIRISGDGAGAILWRELYGYDTWIAFLENEATEEKLMEVKDLLTASMHYEGEE